MTDSLLKRWQHQIKQVRLVPSSGGRFEVTLNGEVVFSKHAVGRHAEPNEIEKLLAERLEQSL